MADEELPEGQEPKTLNMDMDFPFDGLDGSGPLDTLCELTSFWAVPLFCLVRC